jgi:hypothetical protein
MRRFAATILTLTTAAVLFGPVRAKAGDEEGGGFVLTPFYGVSFLKASPHTWSDGRLGGGALQGLALGKRLGDHVLAEVGLAIAPGRSLEERYAIYPPGALADPMPCAPLSEQGGVGGCLIPPIDELGSTRVVSYEYGGSLAIDLGGRDTRPFLSAGLGAATYAIDRSTSTDLRLSFGAGVRRDFGRIAARLEVVDFVSPNGFLTAEVEHDVQIRAGLQVRLP